VCFCCFLFTTVAKQQHYTMTDMIIIIVFMHTAVSWSVNQLVSYSLTNSKVRTSSFTFIFNVARLGDELKVCQIDIS